MCFLNINSHTASFSNILPGTTKDRNPASLPNNNYSWCSPSIWHPGKFKSESLFSYSTKNDTLCFLSAEGLSTTVKEVVGGVKNYIDEALALQKEQTVKSNSSIETSTCPVQIVKETACHSISKLPNRRSSERLFTSEKVPPLPPWRNLKKADDDIANETSWSISRTILRTGGKSWTNICLKNWEAIPTTTSASRQPRTGAANKHYERALDWVKNHINESLALQKEQTVRRNSSIKTSEVQFKLKGNRVQFNFNTSQQEIIRKAINHIGKGDPASALKELKQANNDLAKWNNLILRINLRTGGKSWTNICLKNWQPILMMTNASEQPRTGRRLNIVHQSPPEANEVLPYRRQGSGPSAETYPNPDT